MIPFSYIFQISYVRGRENANIRFSKVFYFQNGVGEEGGSLSVLWEQTPVVRGVASDSLLHAAPCREPYKRRPVVRPTTTSTFILTRTHTRARKYL